MSSGFLHRSVLVAAFLASVAAVSAGVWRYGYLSALDQLAQQGRADLALASDRLTGQLQRYREIAVLLADHPVVPDLAAGNRIEDAAALFLEVADKTAALDVMYVDEDHQVRAAARVQPGADLSQEGFVIRAAQGALGWGHAVGRPLPPRAFYFAAPTFGPTGKTQGSVVVAVDINAMEDAWRGGNRAVFFTDTDGVVFVTNRSELVFWRRDPGAAGLRPPSGAAAAFSSHMSGPHEIWELGWGPYLPHDALHLEQDLPIIGLKGEVLLSVAPARRLASLQAATLAAVFLAFGALLFLAMERRRTLSLANAQLETRVANRTRALSQMNAELRHEATEREEAQVALKQAQSDLVQAGKLSALGQMSAGISHELNQPLMAIRSYAENAVQFMARGQADRAAGNLERISDMARRMGRIIQNLRAFARQESQPAGRVDVVAILDSAIELTHARLARDAITLIYDRPDHPAWVRGGDVRLGQVFVNLITNAADAMASSDAKELRVKVSDDARLTVQFQDTGPGIEMPDKVFEPFYSTKNVGSAEGMGLGLSISYGIVQSFGGEIHGINAETGAIFTVELERWQEEKAA